MIRLPLLSFFVALLSFSSIPVFAQNEPGGSLDDIARFLAGQPVSATSPLEGLMRMPSVRNHYAETQALSQDWEDLRMKKIREWATTEIQSQIARPPETVKYLFGGPDCVHVEGIFGRTSGKRASTGCSPSCCILPP